jgi:hypothetical protein
MADNFGGYVTRVRGILHEANSDASMWSDSFIKQMLNDNYRLRCTQLIMAFEGYFIEIAERNIVADQSRYAWPAGFERLIKLELNRTDGSTVPLARYERHDSRNYAPQAGGDSYHPNYRPIGSGFVLEPGPTEAVTNGLRIEYCALPAELIADDDVLHPDFPRTYVSLLIYDSAVAALDSEHLMENGQPTTIVRLRNEYELSFERYIDGRMVSLDSVTPFVGHYGDS